MSYEGLARYNRLAPVPLPLTWHLYTTVHCPSCGGELNFFVKDEPPSNERYMRCPDLNCPQSRYRYLVSFDVFAVQVREVRDEKPDA